MRPYSLYIEKIASEESGADRAQVAKDVASNLAFGMMSNSRSIAPFSLVGSSMGGVVDGVLMRPAINYGINAIHSLISPDRATQAAG